MKLFSPTLWNKCESVVLVPCHRLIRYELDKNWLSPEHPARGNDLYQPLAKISHRMGASLGGSVVKNPAANAGDARDLGSVPGWGRSPGVGNGNLL